MTTASLPGLPAEILGHILEYLPPVLDNIHRRVCRSWDAHLRRLRPYGSLVHRWRMAAWAIQFGSESYLGWIWDEAATLLPQTEKRCVGNNCGTCTAWHTRSWNTFWAPFAIRSGNMLTLEWLVNRKAIRWTGQEITEAAQKLADDAQCEAMIRTVVDMGCPIEPATMRDGSVLNRPNIMAVLVSLGGKLHGHEVAEHAAYSGDLETVRQIMENRHALGMADSLPPYSKMVVNVMRRAAIGGHVGIVKYLMDYVDKNHVYYGLLTFLLSSASTVHEIDEFYNWLTDWIIEKKWRFVDNPPGRPMADFLFGPQWGMMDIVRRGQVDRLQWMCSHMQGGVHLTIEMFKEAVQYGHMDLLQWMYKYRDKEVPKATYITAMHMLTYAVKIGRTDVAAWVLKKWAKSLKRPAWTMAIWHFCIHEDTPLRALEWVRIQGIGFPPEAYATAASWRRLDVLKWLHSKGVPMRSKCTLESLRKEHGPHWPNWPPWRFVKDRFSDNWAPTRSTGKHLAPPIRELVEPWEREFEETIRSWEGKRRLLESSEGSSKKRKSPPRIGHGVPIKRQR